MKKKTHMILPLFLAILFSLFGSASPIQAAEGGGDGQVTRGGKIIFYEEKEETQESSSTEISTTESIVSSSNMSNIEKPKGIFPKTGEQIQRFAWLGGMLVLLFLLLLFLRNSKRRGQR